MYDDRADEVLAAVVPGEGRFLRRGKSTLPGPRNRWLSEWRPDYVMELEANV